GVPGHAVDTGYAGMIDAGQQMMQAMTEFVEQRGDFIVGQQRRLARDRRREVAHQIGHRALQSTFSRATAITSAVHPGTATLVGARIQVEEETPDVLAVFLDLEQTNIRVPGVEAFLLGNLDAVQTLDDSEQTAEHFIDGEVGTQDFLGNAVALFAQLLAVETAVPALQIRATLFGGVGLELLQVLGRERLAALGQVTQETQHLIAGLGHLGCQAQLGKVRIAKQLRQFLTQVEDLLHDRGIVVLARIRALIRRASAVSRIDFFTQCAVFGVGHHRVVARKFQRDQVAFQILGLGGGSHLLFGRIGQAGEGGLIGDQLGPGLSGIEQLVGKLAAQLRQFALHFSVTLLLFRRQIDAGQAEIAQRLLQNGLLTDVEGGGFRTVGQRFIGLKQCAILAHLGGVGAQRRQARLIRFAQLSAVAHGVQVADRAPGSAQAVIQFVHRQDQPGPGRCRPLFSEDVGNRGTVVRQDFFNSRFDMFGTNRRKGWQVVRLQKRVVRAHGFAPWLEETPSHLNYNRRRPQQPNPLCTPITAKEGAYRGHSQVSGPLPSPRRTGLCRPFSGGYRRC
ncbi:Hexapeptide repeat-containing transferase, partial [Pseudomonas amygdali pv. tabaci]